MTKISSQKFKEKKSLQEKIKDRDLIKDENTLSGEEKTAEQKRRKKLRNEITKKNADISINIDMKVEVIETPMNNSLFMFIDCKIPLLLLRIFIPSRVPRVKI